MELSLEEWRKEIEELGKDYTGCPMKFKGKPFTEYDKKVHQAVRSLYLNGHRFIIPAMIYGAMEVSEEDDLESELGVFLFFLSEFEVFSDNIKNITNSLEKQLESIVEIDLTEKIKTNRKNRKQKISDDMKTIIEIKALTLRKGLLSSDKKEFTVYKILDEPFKF